MTFTDEQLSAFLDAELSEPDMEKIRQQLISDDALSDRLAELAMADQWVRDYATQIDQQPLPASISQQLQRASADANVITFPWWRRAQASVQQHQALAASVVLMLALTLFSGWQWRQQQTSSWSAVAAVLDHTPSQQTQQVDKETRITPLLSFAAHDRQVCRQYLQQSDNENTINLACRGANQPWQLHSSIATELNDDKQFETATQNDPSKTQIDQLIEGDLYDSKQETSAIAQGWPVPNP